MKYNNKLRRCLLIHLVAYVASALTGCDYFKKPTDTSYSYSTNINGYYPVGSMVNTNTKISGYGTFFTIDPTALVVEVSPDIAGKTKFSGDEIWKSLPANDQGIFNAQFEIAANEKLKANTRYAVRIYSEADNVRTTYANWSFATATENLSVTKVSLGYEHGCAILSDSSLNCWGNNRFGELGAVTDGDFSIEPKKILAPSQWQDISAGPSYSCAIASDNTLWCWGRNRNGRLGIGNSTNSVVPAQVGDKTDWQQVNTGGVHACGIDGQKKLWCWGGNSGGQLGVGTKVDSTFPIRVDENDWVYVDAGTAHTCAIQADESMWCWGRNDAGQLGDATVEDSPVPLASLIGSWSTVNIVEDRTCGIKTNGELLCWGSGSDLPNTIESNHGDNAVVKGISGKYVLVDGGSVCRPPWNVQPNTFTRFDCSSVYGSYYTGGLSMKNLAESLYSPFPYYFADGISPKSYQWQQIASNPNSICAISTSGELWCAPVGSSSQRIKHYDDTWKQVMTAASYACAIKMDGSLWCWGENEYGQLAQGVAGGFRDSPVQVGADTDWSSIYLGDETACALKNNGSLWCWGSGMGGQLGDDKYGIASVPIALGTGTVWTTARVAENSICAISDAGYLWCVGSFDSANGYQSSDFRGFPTTSSDVMPSMTQLTLVAKALSFTQPFQVSRSPVYGADASIGIFQSVIPHGVCVVTDSGGRQCLPKAIDRSYFNDTSLSCYWEDGSQHCANSTTTAFCYFDNSRNRHCENYAGTAVDFSEITGLYNPKLDVCRQSKGDTTSPCYRQKDTTNGAWASASRSFDYACGITADGKLSCEGHPANGFYSKNGLDQDSVYNIHFN